jgi:hypothetical protein
VKRARRPLAPLNSDRVTPVRLWPRTRPINRHAIERALRIAAFGSHVCRPFPVRPKGGEAGH